MRRWMSIITATCARKKRILGHFCEQCVTWGESDCVGEQPVATIPNPIKCLGIRKMMSKDFNVIKKQTNNNKNLHKWVILGASAWPFGTNQELLFLSANKTEEILIRNMTFFVCVCVWLPKKVEWQFFGWLSKTFQTIRWRYLVSNGR